MYSRGLFMMNKLDKKHNSLYIRLILIEFFDSSNLSEAISHLVTAFSSI